MVPPVKRNRKSLEPVVSLIKAVLKLLKKNVPVAAIWYQGGQVRKLGSQSLAKWLESLDESVLLNAMDSDEESLQNGDEPLVCNDDEDETCEKIMASFKQTELKRLPCPLSLMSKREKMKYISDEIWNENRNRHVRMIYGHPACKPTFWPQDSWAWELCTNRLALIKDEYTGPGNFLDFLSSCIRKLFGVHGKDPETYVSQEVSEETITKKMWQRGLKAEVMDSKSITEASLDLVRFGSVDSISNEYHPIEAKEEMEEMHDNDEEFMDKQPISNVSEEIVAENKVLETKKDEILTEDAEEDFAVNVDRMEHGTGEDDPVCITISSKGHEPIQITMNRLKRKRPCDS